MFTQSLSKMFNKEQNTQVIEGVPPSYQNTWEILNDYVQTISKQPQSR